MKKASLKSLLADIGVLIFSALILYLAYLIIIEGAVPTRFENGYHTFNGVERILGFGPLIFGGLLQYLMWSKFKCRFLNKKRFEREYGERANDKSGQLYQGREEKGQ